MNHNPNKETPQPMHEVDRVIAEYGHPPSDLQKQKIAEVLAGERANFLAIESEKNRLREQQGRDRSDRSR